MQTMMMTEVTLLGKAFNVYEILRLITIVGAYLLFRPYLLKLTQKFQEQDHARPLISSEQDTPAVAAAGGGGRRRRRRRSALLGGGGGGDSSEESDDGGEEEMSWGAKVRRRKRAETKALKEAIQKEEEARACEESDEDIAEFLEKED